MLELNSTSHFSTGIVIVVVYAYSSVWNIPFFKSIIIDIGMIIL